ncbi:hypothetical protein MMC29_003076 [Sticta canariensis]|nr:hypothetical protein [Sticta canariensis]
MAEQQPVQSSNTTATPPPCTPLEQQVLDEYALLLNNLNNLSAQLNALADRPTGEVLDGLRMLERKTSLVLTLLKASVYSIVLQQQIYGGEEDA